MFADAKGMTKVAFANAARDRAAAMTYSLKSLPYLTVWKNTAAAEDGYVTGIEPGTNFPYNRRLERTAGRVPQLAGGDKYEVGIDVSLLGNKEAVAAALKAIDSIQATRSTEFVAKPAPPQLPEEK